MQSECNLVHACVCVPCTRLTRAVRRKALASCSKALYTSTNFSRVSFELRKGPKRSLEAT